MGRGLVHLRNWRKAAVVGAGWRGGSKEHQETCRSCKDFAWKSSAQYLRASCSHETGFSVHLKLLSGELMAEGQERRWCPLGDHCSSAGDRQ